MGAEGLAPHHAQVGILLALYALTLLLSLGGLKKPGLKKVSVWFLAAAFVMNGWLIGLRWVEAGRPPFKTLYETLVFYPFCVAVVTFALLYLHRLFVLVPFASGVSVAGLAYALYRPDIEIMNLPPALQSGWFIPHVVTYFVAYAGLFASFALAILALGYPWWRRRKGQTGPGPDFATYAHNAAVFGVVALTLGLVMGAVWGKLAWGDYWAWDPKENWALISWLAYMIYFHLRRTPGWKAEQAMWVLVVAFAAVVFTYLGMNLLPTAQESLHVYQ